MLNYDNRPNVVGTFRGTGGGRSLILNGHIDTVTVEPEEAWTRNPFSGDIDTGLMYGRGTSDMKGGLMAAVMAMAYLLEAGASLKGDVILQSVVNEEHAGNGTLDLVRRGYRADGAIVLEPTNNTIAVSHPGGLYWQVTVPGIVRSPGARWSGDEIVGVSAIEKLPRIIDALLALELAYNSVPNDDPMEAGRVPFALTIGKVAGGFYETATAGEATLRGGAYVLRQMKRDRFPPHPGRSRPACGASVPGRLCAPALSDPDVPADCPARRGRGGISDGVHDPRGTCRSPTW